MKGEPMDRTVELSELEAEAVDYFVSFVQVFGLPKSIGQIYGLLFVSAEPLSMDDVVRRLGISKGSASQGLALLRNLGGVTTETVPGDRREHYLADLNVSRIVSHFLDNRLLPRLAHAEDRLSTMLQQARREQENFPGPGAEQRLNRIRALQKWQKRGSGLIPMILRWFRD
jgi:DNA-binding transcriptional regulator GbsR (MarR family)